MGAEESLKRIGRELARFRRWWGLNLAAPVLAASLWLALAAGGAAVLADMRWGLAAPVRLGAAALVFAVLLAGAIAAVLGWRRIRADERVALAVEAADAGFRNRIITAVQLAGEPSGLYSGLLTARLYAQVGDELARLPLAGFMPARRLAVGAAASVLALCLAATPFLAAPGPARSALMRFAPPYADPAVVIRFEVEPGDAVAVYGDRLRVRACASTPVAESPRILVADGPESLSMEPVGGGCFVRVFPRLQADLRYRVAVRDFSSREYLIRVLRRPQVRDARFRIIPPEYSGLPEAVQSHGHIEALKGTRVEFEARTTKPLRSARLEFESGESLPVSVQGRELAADFVVESGDAYRILLTDEDGLDNQDPALYGIAALTDRAGHIRITAPAENVTLDQGQTLQVRVQAGDDYGVAAINIVGFLDDPESVKRIPLRFEPDRSVETGGVVDPGLWGAAPGETLSYYAEMEDNDAVTGPKRSVSAAYVITLTSPSAGYMNLMREIDAQLDDLQSHSEQQSSAAARMDQLRRELERGEELTWEKSKQIEQQLQRQQAAQEQMAAAAEEMKDQLAETADNPFLNPEILERYLDVQQLLSEVVTDSMRDSMKRIQEALEQMDAETLKQAAAAMDFDADKLVRDLDRNIERLRRIQAEQKLWGLYQQAERLAEEQKLLARETESAARTGDPDRIDRLSRRQSGLKDQADDLFGQIHDLQRDMARIDAAAAQGLERIKESGLEQEIGSNMQSALEGIKGRDWQAARDMQGSAQQGLEQLAESLSGLRLETRARADAEFERLLQWIGWEAIIISERVELAFNELLGISGRRRHLDRIELNAVLQEPLQTLHQDIRSAMKLLARLEQLAAVKLDIGAPMIDLAVAAVTDMESAAAQAGIERLESALGLLSRSMSGFNEVAARTLEMNRMLSMMPETMCMEGFMQGLETLAGMQSALNQGALRLSESGLPLMGAEGQKQLRDMAGQQQMINQGLQQLLDRAGDEAGRAGERLGGMAGELDEIEHRLRSGELDERLIDTQRRVYRRMMQEIRALYKETEYAPGFESRTARQPGARDPIIQREVQAPRLPAFLERAMERYNAVPVPGEFREPARRYYDVLYRELVMPLH